jgi:hypothetical protein
MRLVTMILLAIFVHFFHDPNSAGWLLVAYCLYYDVRGIRGWLLRLASEYLDVVV